MAPWPGEISIGRICPGNLAAKASSPGPPTAVYSVMNKVPPATARPSAPMNPPCWPPADVEVCIWIAIDIHESCPDSAKTLSLGCMFSSSTGMTVPTIFGSMVPPSGFPSPLGERVRERGVNRQYGNVSGARVASRVMDVLERVAPGRLPAGRPRARFADSDHQHLGVHRLEPLAVLAGSLPLDHQRPFHVHHAATKLADRVLMVARGQLVVGRPVAKVRGVHGPRCGQPIHRPIHGAARKARLRFVQLSGDLVGGAVPAEPHDRVVDHRPLPGPPHPPPNHVPSPLFR